MGVRGPKPKSTKAHQLEGTFHPTRHGKRKPLKVPAKGKSLRSPPEHLSDLQKKLWQETVADAPQDVLARIDTATLVAYIVAYSRLIEANLAQQRHEEVCRKNGTEPLLMTTTSGNIIQSPFIGAMNRATDKIRALAAEMGFTPVSRTRLSAAIGETLDVPSASSMDDLVAGDQLDNVVALRPK
jgi:P27 family predicted phage terminase small subunit